MKVVQKPIAEVKPYGGNPRKMSDEAIATVATSLQEYGWRQPIVVDEEMVVIVGHTRLLAAKTLGMEKVPVHVADGLSDDQVRAYRIADNASGERTTWDKDLLPLELDMLKAADFDLTLTALTDEMLADMEDNDEVEEPEEVEPPAEPVTQRGDLIKMGEHRLVCGDSTNKDDVHLLFEDAKADMILSDPPYGVSYVGKTKDALTIENDALSEDQLVELMDKAFGWADDYSREGSYWYATVPAGPLFMLFAQDWKDRGILRQVLVWKKDAMVMGRSEYHYQHEPILFGWKEGKRHKNTDRTRTSVWDVPRPKASREHPTMKPIALWQLAMKDGSRKGEIVYDPFSGSGTTILCADQMGRKGYGMELDPSYCDVIVTRWEKQSGEKAERISAK